MERQPLPISLPWVWPVTSSIHIYRTSESTNSLSSLTRESYYYLSGRHADNREVSKGDPELQRYSDSLVTGVGLYNKSGKISDHSHTDDRVLGYGNRLKDNDCFITTRESSEDQTKMPESISESSCARFRINKSPG